MQTIKTGMRARAATGSIRQPPKVSRRKKGMQEKKQSVKTEHDQKESR